MGGVMGRGGSWTAGEDTLLAAHYPDWGGDWDGWAALLPGRSMASIRSRAHKLGLRMAPEAVSARRARGGIAASEARVAARDGREGAVMVLLDHGLPPSAIDARLGYEPGTAIRVISARWRRKKREEDMA